MINPEDLKPRTLSPTLRAKFEAMRDSWLSTPTRTLRVENGKGGYFVFTAMDIVEDINDILSKPDSFWGQ